MGKLNNPTPALAVVNNPTQLLFAIEAASANALDLAELRVVIVPTPGARDEILYQNLLLAAGVGNIEWLPVDSLSLTGRIRDAVRMSRSINRATKIITPMINYYPARALLNRAGSNAVITDDGSWTLHFARGRQLGESQHRTPLHALLPFGTLPPSLNFFTIYPELTAGKSDKVTANQLDWTKRVFYQGAQGSHMVILGSDLTRSGYIDEALFERRVGELRGFHGGTAEYWPHRRESQSLAERLCRTFDMTLKQRTLPLEAELLAVNPSPAIVATLPSTATRTLRMLQSIVPYQIVVAGLEEGQIAHGRQELFRSVSQSAETDADVIV